MRKPLRIAVAVACTLLLGLTTAAQASTPKDKSFSPYFVVKTKDAKADGLPLKESRAEVNISGVIAHVKVTQTYANLGKTPIEAIYVFPGSTRAAVFGMKMKIGKRTVVAKIEKKEQARKLYEAAKSQGKNASLLEQHRPNVFQMNVANIMPGDVIQVELNYTELMVPDGGTYEFVYPAVVGPRFTGEAGKKAGQSAWTKTPYTKSGKPASYAWGMKVRLDGGVPIQSVSSPSHKISAHTRENIADITLGEKEQGGDRDFVLRYRLSGKSIQSGLVLFPGEKENFFLMMMQPPKRVKRDRIPKREYVFILDVSGSMYGFPLETSKRLMKRLFKGLNKHDRFNILFFSGRSALLSEKSLPATEQNLNVALAKFNRMRGGGGTRLLSALQRATALPTNDEYSRSFVVVTDGYISVEPRVFEHIRNNLGNANLFTFGIGSSVNRHLIDGMSRVGMGEPFVALNGTEAERVADKFKTVIESPVLTNIKVNAVGFKAYDVTPHAIPDLFAQRPVVVFGKYRGQPQGRIVVTGTHGKGNFVQAVKVNDFKPSKNNAAIRYLWARHRIAALSDLNRLSRDDKRVKEVTQLGLKYNLMTAYTSFVAIDNAVRNEGGKQTQVKQPLPLPKGVSNAAIGLGRTKSRRGGPRPYLVKSATRGKLSAPMSGSSATRLKVGKKESFRIGRKPMDANGLTPLLLSVNGNITRSNAIRIIRRALKRCRKAPAAGVRGIMWFEAKIGKNGKLEILTITNSSLTDTSMRKCLMKALKRMRFTRSSRSRTLKFGVRVAF